MNESDENILIDGSDLCIVLDRIQWGIALYKKILYRGKIRTVYEDIDGKYVDSYFSFEDIARKANKSK